MMALAIGLAAIATQAALAGPAAARTIPVYTYSGHYYDGQGSTAGTLATGTDVDLNQTNGNGYVTDPNRMNGSFSQFDADGDPLAFPGLDGATAISLHGEGAQRVAVDNSSTSSQGNIYVLENNNLIKGYAPDGTLLAGSFPISSLRTACSVAVDSQGDIWGVDYRRSAMLEYSSSGAPTGKVIPIKPVAELTQNGGCDLAIDSEDNLYLSIFGYLNEFTSYSKKFDSDGNYLYDFAGGFASSVAVDRSDDHVFTLQPTPFGGGEYDTEVVEYDQNGEAITSFGAPDPAHGFLGLSAPTGIAVNEHTHDIYVTNGRDYGGRQHVEIFAPSSQALVPTVKSEAPGLAPTQVTLKGTVDLDGGGDTTDCYFEWGSTYTYGNVVPCAPAGPITGSGPHQVTALVEGLTQGSIYHFRIVAKNANGIPAFGSDRSFRPAAAVSISATKVSDVNTDGARISADIDPNGGETSYRVEYGPEDCDLSSCQSAPLPSALLANPLGAQHVSVVLSGLAPESSYHYRLVASSEFGTVSGTEDTLKTYAIEPTTDSCSNALLRKEMAAVLLPDCRAYELVSALDAGGYDVRSDLVPGQVPFAAKPRAADTLLYSLNFGKVPGVSGEPTNHGLDPYLAKRTASGWSTAYAGIPVGGPPYQEPFSSTPVAESEDLSTIAFGGDDICEPCFADGKTGIPLRRDGGLTAQGMAGSLDPGASVSQDGYVGRLLSADGTHLVFGSTSAFENDAATGGDTSIYDRNLLTGVTHVVSKTPSGDNLPCLQGAGACHGPANGDGIASLDVSENGSRIIVANRVSTDSAGNRYWHPYMNIGDASSSVDLAPGATDGVLYDGMTADGSAVFFTTVDALSGDDHDSSADIYRADVSAAGAVSLSLVSAGAGAGNSDSCDPVPAPGSGNNWNAPGPASANGCGAVAFAGGAGVARSGGAIFFLSPERLDGASGVEGEANLYLSAPGAPPRFVATLEPGSEAIRHAVYEGDESSFGDIQVSADGNFAAFSSSRDLIGFPTFGHTAIYRYAAAGAGVLVCASCPTTRAALTADTLLDPYGLNLTDDGRVFFTSAEPLALRDTGTTKDIYEWSQGRISILSTGRSQTDSGLLSVGADGVDAYFYTRESLVGGDHNGTTMKIYDARERGGFPAPIVVNDCQASDECHGPGSAAPPAEPLPTYDGNGGNYTPPAVKKPKKPKKKHPHPRKHRHHKKHHPRSGR